MIVYLASIYNSNIGLSSNIFRRFAPVEQQARLGITHILESYHYLQAGKAVDSMRRDGAKIFLDSGAYSAFTGGHVIQLESYCNFIHRNPDVIEIASVLDGIGDPLKTWQNQQQMEALGTKPLPCFHYGEDERYLKHYLDNYEYITLGGMVPIAKPQLLIWLDRIWEKYLTDPRTHLPICKVHGFGITTKEIMLRYPWYSVDSSTWVQWARVGAIMLPDYKAMIMVSKDSPTAKDRGKHLDTYSPQERAVIIDEIERRGFEVKRLRETYVARWAFNMKTFQELCNPNAPEKRFMVKQNELF